MLSLAPQNEGDWQFDTICMAASIHILCSSHAYFYLEYCEQPRCRAAVTEVSCLTNCTHSSASILPCRQPHLCWQMIQEIEGMQTETWHRYQLHILSYIALFVANFAFWSRSRKPWCYVLVTSRESERSVGHCGVMVATCQHVATKKCAASWSFCIRWNQGTFPAPARLAKDLET